MKSIRRQLTIWLLLGGVLLLGGSGGITYFLVRHALLAEVDSRLRVEALAVIKQTAQEPDDEAERHGPRENRGKTAYAPELEVRFTEKYMPEFEKGGTEFFQLWDANGKSIKRSDSLNKADLPLRFGSIESPAYWNLILPNGQYARAVGIRFVPPSARRNQNQYDPNFHATAVVAGELGPARHALDSLRGVLLGVGLIAAAATLLVMPPVLRHALAPVDRVATHAASLEAGNLHSPFPVADMPVELRPICARLNELLMRLEESFEHERRFSADVAHELRTPIAELRSLAEVNLKWPEDEAGRMKSFRDALAAARQMEGIVTSLLAIAHCEAGERTLASESICLSGFVMERWQPFAAKAASKQLGVTMTIPASAQLQTDRALLGQILTNLFSNATDYTPDFGTIEADWIANEDGWTLSISNSTRNLMREEIPNLFKRFWRKDEVRSSSEHSGLGLAVARATATALGFVLCASMNRERILTMKLTGFLPTDGNQRIKQGTGQKPVGEIES